jgi:hypothetical protein
MKSNNLYILLLLSIILIVGSCKKSDPVPSFHYEYFGMEEGLYVIYDVVDIIHDADLDQHDTTYYQIKTKWGQPYVDNIGRDAREFYRYRRNTVNDDWVQTDVWTGIIVDRRAELIEENQRVIKLFFAPTSQKIWNANAYNTYDELESYYDDIHKDKTIGGTYFDSTLVVEHVDEKNFIDDIRIYEVYAKGIGMVKSYYRKNNYQGTLEVDLGKELYFTYYSSGVE